jgi:hypothetical protein
MPYENDAVFSRALQPFRFGLDRRTSAIVVQDSAKAEAEQQPNPPLKHETAVAVDS